MTTDEFRPADLGLGWNSNPEWDIRNWITKTTETEYYKLVGDYGVRREHFLKNLESDDDTDKKKVYAKIIEKNAMFVDEPIYAKELRDKAKNILNKYAVGNLLVSGDNRYLCDDLMRLLGYIVKCSEGESKAYNALEKEFLTDNFMYAPRATYEENEFYTLLRSPHIARNEEAIARLLKNIGKLREKYLSHLRYVAMVDSRSLISERLGGADFDGDMVKTVYDKLLNACVMKSSTTLPVLKIPTAEPLISDANDWYARFLTVKSTFSSRVGQISNAALSRGIIAYDENTANEDKEKYYHEVETLAILTGLEIDSAKSGVKPDLSEYIEKKTARRSIFLRYKSIVGSDENHKWYEPSKNARLKKYFDSIDWNKVSSNLEKLPYLAYMLERETKTVTVRPVSDEQLFNFAQTPDWKENLDSTLLSRVASLIADYETALSRVRYIKHISIDMKRKGDIYRILFARGQEKDYTVDELYSVFDTMLPQQIRKARLMLDEVKWHLVPPEERTNILYTICRTGNLYDYLDVFSDFRNGGYRIVGDIICDLDDMYRKMGMQKNFAKQKGDSKDLQALLLGITARADYKEQIIRNCMNIIRPLNGKNCLDYTEVVKCAVALGKRQFVLEALPSVVLEQAIDNNETKPKKKWRLW
jgi:hypothetical protein